MADPITREQVERAMDAAYDCNAQGVNAALGAFWYERDDIPQDVRDGGKAVGYRDLRIALTRWRDELAAAETPDDTAPERLRERREALAWDLDDAADACTAAPGGRWHTGNDIARLESCEWPLDDVIKAARARYAAALSAEEASRRAADRQEAEAHRVARQTPDPERPAPRFKVGDWVRVVNNGTVYQVGEIATPFGGNAYYFRETGGADNSWLAAALEPDSPPAPDVVDVPQPDPLAYADSPVWDDGPMLARPVPEAVPQPEPWHARLVRLATEAQAAGKACAEAEAAFKVADAERERARLARAVAREVCHVKRQALTEATTARAILDAQQPARDRMPPGEPKLLDAEPTRPEPRYKVGDWVRVVTGPNSAGRTTPIRVTCVTSAGYIMADGASWAAENLTPALDPALHETARTAARMLLCGKWPLGLPRVRELPGFDAWNLGPLKSSEWAAQLERLLGDAP